MNRSNKVTITSTIIALVITQLACQTLVPTTGAEPSSVPSAAATQPVNIIKLTPTDVFTDNSQFSDDEIMEGIQDTLDDYANAYTNNKSELIDYIVDTTNKPFRRIVRSRFDTYQKSALAGNDRFSYKLLNITRREYGYVIAHVETRGGYRYDWPFRYLGNHWVLTEPTVEQVGEPVTIETEYFTFTTYPWADDVNNRIIELVEEARQNVEDVLGKVPDEKANVIILPIYGLRPGNPSSAIALYAASQGTIKNVIQIYAPNSYAFSFYDPSIGWDGDLSDTLTHEYTHMTHLLSFNRSGRLADWMSEGLAEFVAGQTINTYTACNAEKAGAFIPIIDESDTVYKQDLMHLTILNADLRLGYDYGTSLVQYTVEKYGSLDGFWKLANALDETSDFKKAVPKAFGISYDQYNQGWQTWLKKQC